MNIDPFANSQPDPELQAVYALIGEFMSHWATLENALNNGVHMLCGLSGIEAAAVTANMGVRDKINTVRSMLHLAHHSQEEASKENSKLMERIGDRSADRNIVAHTQFVADPKGVRFLIIRAKSRFEIPPTIWTTDDFRERNHKMIACGRQLDAAVKRAVARRNQIKFGVSMTSNPFAAPPIEEPGLLGGLFHLGRLHLDDPDNQPPTPKSGRGRSKAPRGKSPKD